VCLLAASAGFAARSAPAAGVAHADAPERDAAEPCSPAWLREAPLSSGEQVMLQSSTTLAPPTEQEAEPAAAGEPVPPVAAEGASTADSEVRTQANTRPNDMYFKMYKQNLLMIGALQAWETSYGAGDMVIAVIADGVEYTHPDLVGKLWRNPRELAGNRRDDDGNGYADDTIGWDFASSAAPEDNDPMPVPQSQLDVIMPVNGTAIAGIAAADTNNGAGIAGVSWGARIMPLKIFKRDRIPLRQPNPRIDPDGDGYFWGTSTDWEHFSRAVCYAANNGADVIAIGGLMFYNPYGAGPVLERAQAAISFARLQGAIVVAGAGECGKNIPGVTWWCPDPARFGENVPAFPAAFEDVIGVQSFESGYRRRAYEMRPYASSGDWVDLAAPGEGYYAVWRTGTPNDYQEIDSNFKVPSELAAAHVAGAVAVMKGLNLGFSPSNIDNKLCETANRSQIPADLAGGPFDDRSPGGFPRNDRFGCGVLNFERAVEEMPWQVRVMPGKVMHMVDRSESLPKVLLSSTNLNEGRWQIESSEDWLQAEAVPQDIGQPSQVEMEIDGAALQRDQGPLQGYRTVKPEVVARAVNDENPTMAQSSTSQTLTYEVYIVDRIWRAFLPTVRR
jgi:subtilisin family serine protease